MSDLHFETLALHAGYDPKDHNKSATPPIYQTTAFQFDDANHAADLFALKTFGNIYSRIMNPTQAVLEDKFAALEGGTTALATSSGHAAQFLTFTTLAKAGDNIIASKQLYGGSFNQLNVTTRRLGIEPRFFNPLKAADVEVLIDENTKCIFIESLGNPSLRIPDFKAIATIAQKYGLPFVVDNTLCSPYLFKPLEHGANIITHSCTKYISGWGNGIGGIIVDGGNFDWGETDRFPEFTQPNTAYHGLVYNEVFGKKGPFGNLAFAIKARVEGLRDIGPCLAPFQAYLFLQGLTTLSLRIDRQIKNTRQLTQWLQNHPKVSNVVAAEVGDGTQIERRKQYFPKGASALLSFEIEGGETAGKRFVESVKVAFHQANLGDCRTIVTHPWSTTHSQLSDENKLAAGVAPGLVRISVGIEHIDDLITDFDQAIF